MSTRGKPAVAAIALCRQRSQMVALHGSGIRLRMISWFLNRHRTTVRRWILRAENHEPLQDRKRNGRPAVYSQETKLKTIAFYCQVSPLPGFGSWSSRWAAKYLDSHRDILGCAPSYSTILRNLTSHALRPYLHKYFLTVTDPDFFPKMEHIIDLYLKPPEYLFNFDECPGIQVTHPLSPNLPASPGTPQYEDPSYKRNGTVDLLAFLNPKDGKVFGRCTDNHNTRTLIDVFREHVATLPSDASLHYIMDNLSTHFHEEFCNTVAELSNVSYSFLKTGKERRRWLQSDHKRIVIHFVPFHGSWLNMIEIWFGILNKRFLKHQPLASRRFTRESIHSAIDMWNELFSHPFSWKYTGAGLHEKVINRFNTQLLIENKQMDCKSLTKQLSLMYNMAQEYPQKTETAEWNQLRNLFQRRGSYFDAVINDSDVKERAKANACEALDRLSAMLIPPAA